MSSISAQGVVERASAELSKRINGLGLRGSKHHQASAAAGKGSSVMERVTNVFCGGGGAAAASVAAAPEKPSRMPSAAASGRTKGATARGRQRQQPPPPPPAYLTWDQLMADERFLGRFFLYFTACERCVLAQVCSRWRDVLYRSPRYWSGLVPVLQCRDMRGSQGNERARLYSSLLRRGFHSLRLVGASDEDALELVNTFPLASKHIHTVSLRCSSITDRGLESLLDHLQALYELELAGCNEITEAGLWACLNPRIVSLTLTDCINVADEAVGAVAQLLPALYEFSLQAYHVTDAALGYSSPKQSNSLNVLRLHSLLGDH
ncbi:hypothetical protein NQ318_022177 [Aromia moschata]|uniref:F-box/LRR-repeat protein 16 n=1 Tax=Aromia moschata TaxID=1265417 RepID=A0AAV8Z5L0_9CUCU|nr:hypothetical protein NQ318_022177 [Aromia moschata]